MTAPAFSLLVCLPLLHQCKQIMCEKSQKTTRVAFKIPAVIHSLRHAEEQPNAVMRHRRNFYCHSNRVVPEYGQMLGNFLDPHTLAAIELNYDRLLAPAAKAHQIMLAVATISTHSAHFKGARGDDSNAASTIGMPFFLCSTSISAHKPAPIELSSSIYTLQNLYKSF